MTQYESEKLNVKIEKN